MEQDWELPPLGILAPQAGAGRPPAGKAFVPHSLPQLLEEESLLRHLLGRLQEENFQGLDFHLGCQDFDSVGLPRWRLRFLSVPRSEASRGWGAEPLAKPDARLQPRCEAQPPSRKMDSCLLQARMLLADCLDAQPQDALLGSDPGWAVLLERRAWARQPEDRSALGNPGAGADSRRD